MAESKKKSGGAPASTSSRGPESIPHVPWTGVLPREELDALSVLQLIDLVARSLPPRHAALLDLAYLRDRVADIEEVNDQARTALEKLEAIVEKLRSPAFRVATFLSKVEPDLAQVSMSGSDYVCRVDPDVPLVSLQTGQRVLLNEAFAVVKGLGFETGGPVARIEELLSDGRLRIGQESSMQPVVLRRSELLGKEKLRVGMDVRLDFNQRVALEVVGGGKRIDRQLAAVAELPWSEIGGQEEAVGAIRETIELPMLHRDLFQRFEYTIPKGFLLYGPPGCGKTMLGKATAYNLRCQIREQTGVDRPEYFLHVKGPEILNMWVGESERQVRDLFAQCRERAQNGALAFLFIDEAESILGTRHGGRYHSMVSTLVPMFCTEMDGLEPLQNVVVILASNRADLIDPAILRPGRIDRKIKVRRPDLAGARSIYEIYLRETLPLGEPRGDLADAVASRHYARIEENQFLEVIYRSGRREVLHRGDMASGAIIAAVVERAKSLAIRRSIETSAETQLTREDLLTALRIEHGENELFPASDLTEDWLKLTDYDPENVVRLGPIRPRLQAPGGVV
jgi:proteasome-associated ATPase